MKFSKLQLCVGREWSGWVGLLLKLFSLVVYSCLSKCPSLSVWESICDVEVSNATSWLIFMASNYCFVTDASTKIQEPKVRLISLVVKIWHQTSSSPW